MLQDQNTTISIRCSAEEKKYWEREAREKGVPIDLFLANAIRFRMKLDDGFFVYVARLGELLRVDPALVLQNLAICWAARKDAKIECQGHIQRNWREARNPQEFIFTKKGVVTGMELYHLHRADNVRLFNLYREKKIAKREKREKREEQNRLRKAEKKKERQQKEENKRS